jgi:hypothetical protein
MRFSRRWLWRMPFSGMLCRVTLVRTDVSEERIVSIIRVTRIDELGTTVGVTSSRRKLRRNIIFGCHPVDGGATFLRIVASYKSHTAYRPRRRRSSMWNLVEIHSKASEITLGRGKSKKLNAEVFTSMLDKSFTENNFQLKLRFSIYIEIYLCKSQKRTIK